MDAFDVGRRYGFGLRYRPFQHRSLGHQWRSDGLLEEAAGERPAFPRVATVEPETELIEVGLLADRL